jgi:hypothetical protein
MGLAGCGGAGGAAFDKDAQIAVTGLPDGDITVSIGDIAALENVTEKAEATRSNGTTVEITAVGPTLDTFLAQYGVSQTDYASIRFTATDGYAIAIPKELLERRTIILAYQNGDKPLGEDAAPLQIVVPGERAMYWARMLEKIELRQAGASTLSDKIVFLDAALPELKGAYSQEEGGDIVGTKDLTERFGGGAGEVTMIASDGLTKNETAENFLRGFIKYTGDKIPQFCSPDLPLGMNIDGLLSIRTDNVLYYSLDRAQDTLTEKEGSGKKGIAFSDIVKDNKFGSAESYEITSQSGEKTIFVEQELVMGVFVKEDGAWHFWSGAEKAVKNVLSVEAKH